MVFLFMLFSVTVEKLPFDSGKSIYDWTFSYEKDCRLFPEIEGFQKAEILRRGGRIVLRIEGVRNGQPFEDERNLTEEEYSNIVSTVDAYLLSFKKLNREGWGLYLLATLEVGLVEWSPMGAIVTEKAELYPIFAAASFFAPMFLTRNVDITNGQAWFSWIMAHHAYLFGVSTSMLLLDSTNSKFIAGYMLGTGILGEIAGFKLARKWNLSMGSAEMYNHILLSSEIYGWLLANALFSGKQNLWDYLWTGALIGEIAGFTGWYMWGKDEYTFGDAIAYDSYGFLALLTSYATISSISNSVDDKWKSLIVLGIHAPVNLYGLKIFRNNQIPLTGGLAIIGGTAAGLLLGIGTGALLGLDESNEWWWALAAGGWIGFIPSYLMAKGMSGGNTMLEIHPEIGFADSKPIYGLEISARF